MGKILLEGATLGQRHRHYNQLLKVAITSGTVKPAAIDYNKTDIENIFNIDIASNNRDVEYILNVLKSDDMLYISRAIKRSNWLFTDAQYSHIIEPVYLHSELFPKMMPKASCKLLLHIRLTVKDKSQVEKFYHYFNEKDLNMAFKWLPNCPINVIENAVQKHALEIPPVTFGRLCKIYPKIFEIFERTVQEDCPTHYLTAVMFLLHRYLELYLNMVEKKCNHDFPHFNKKYTKLLMKRCPERIKNNFHKYLYGIHHETFAKYLKQEDIKTFIVNQMKNNIIKFWFTNDEDKIINLIKHLPKDDKYDLISQFIDNKTDSNNDDWGIIRWAMSSHCNWIKYLYKFMPFAAVFPELKEKIRTEPNSVKRNEKLMLLAATQKDLTDINTLLRYYRVTHADESFQLKIQFVNELLLNTDSHLIYLTHCNIWTLLEELFHSTEMYNESQNNVQACIEAIIAYKVLHDEPVPQIIENKFQFDTLKSFKRKLKGAYKQKLFKYLLDSRLNILNSLTISNEAELNACAQLLKQTLNLLNDWDKELAKYPILINKIKDCVKIGKENEWSTSSLVDLYLMKKSWKKTMFDESLILSPSETTIMNALKHDPELLRRNINEVDVVACNEFIRLDKVLGKLRVYWPETLAAEWISECHVRLNMPGIPAHHKARVRGLFCLLNQHQFSEFVKLHEPQETKIDWINGDKRLLGRRKIIAQNMHIARPQVTLDAILSYAKGDYVQFSQPALNSIMSNLRATEIQECIQNHLNGAPSLQKYGNHLAFVKLSTVDKKKLLGDVRETYESLSIRTVLFRSIHKLLCKEQDEALIAELWGLMNTFIDSLTAKENRTIYVTLGNVAKIHKSIKPAFCMKSYCFLNSLPPKINCMEMLFDIKGEMIDIIEDLDADFTETLIEEFVNDAILNKRDRWNNRHNLKILALYLLSIDNESTQNKRFEKVFVPLVTHCVSLLNNDNNYIIHKNFMEIIQALHRYQEYAFLKNKINPSSLYRNIKKNLESKLPATQNIILFRRLSLAAALADVYDKHTISDSSLSDQSKLNELYLACIADVGNTVIRCLKEDIETYGCFLYQPIAEALETLFEAFGINSSTKIKHWEYMCSKDDCVSVYLLVIQLIRSYWSLMAGPADKERMKNIRLMLKSHPSPVVQIHYFMKFGRYLEPEEK